MTLLTPPPSRVLLMRHAKSAWPSPGQSDFDRPLDDEGYAEAELVADKVADLDLRPDRVIVSTARRCRETAEALKRAFDEELDIQYSDSLYHGHAALYAEIIASQGDCRSVMIVGHNPSIEELLYRLAGSAASTRYVPEGYPPAGLAVLDAVEPGWQIAEFFSGNGH